MFYFTKKVANHEKVLKNSQSADNQLITPPPPPLFRIILNKSSCSARKFVFLFACLLGLLCSSCGTLFTGTSDTIFFDSNPSGATVVVDGDEICRTPCQESIGRRTFKSKMVNVKLDGYRVETKKLKKSFNAATLLNILLGGILGVTIDLITGSVTKYSPTKYFFKLERKNSYSLNSNESIKKIEIDTKKKLVTVTGSQE